MCFNTYGGNLILEVINYTGVDIQQVRRMLRVENIFVRDFDERTFCHVFFKVSEKPKEELIKQILNLNHEVYYKE